MSLTTEIFVLLLSIGIVVCGDCPKEDLIKPCTCDKNTISCITNEEFELDNVFIEIAKGKSLAFDTFILNSTEIEKLDEVFRGITFRTIELLDCHALTCVSPMAFRGMEKNVTTFRAIGTSFSSSDKECNLFEALNGLYNLQTINITKSSISEIPANAFDGKTGASVSLAVVDLSGGHGGDITKIGKNAFSGLKGLQYLDLSSHKISQIDSYGFAFIEPKKSKLLVNLEHNLLNPKSFAVESLEVNERITELRLGANPDLKVLNELVFQPFLINKINSSEYNRIDLNGSELECSPNNLWILENEASLNLRQKLVNVLATDGQLFWKHTKTECKNPISSSTTHKPLINMQ